MNSVYKNQVHSENLRDIALLAPRISDGHPDTLRIVSGYTSPGMAVTHFKDIGTLAKKHHTKLPLNIDLVYGMVGAEGITKQRHLGFVSLVKQDEFEYDGSFSCSYVPKPLSVHSKVYVWCNGNVPIRAFVGSANYSEMAFCTQSRVETLSECDPDSALEFFDGIKAKAIDCLKANIDKDFKAKPYKPKQSQGAAFGIEDDVTSPYFGHEKVTLSLLTRKHDLGTHSGLNWGVSKNGSPRIDGKTERDPNQAYIRLPASVYRSDFFPPRFVSFSVTTDDNVVMTCVRAQDSGKAIHTTYDNAELGRYFRKRMGRPSGSYLTVQDAKNYGRLNVVFYKVDELSYHMDFSVHKD